MPQSRFFPRFTAIFLALGLLTGGSQPGVTDSAPSVSTSAEAVIPTNLGELRGTLSLPRPGIEATGDAVMFIAGSGPVDRDGNAPGLRNDGHLMMARALADAGIVSLRVDKRGVAASAAAGPDESTLRFETYVADAVSWLDYLRAQDGVERVYLAGHSEGALVATLAAQRRPVDGLILLAGGGSPANVVIRRQLTEAGLPAETLDDMLSVLDRIEAGETVSDMPPYLIPLFRPSVQPYLHSWFALDPAAELARVSVPILIVQGDSDLQVRRDDALKLSAVQPDARLIEIAGMNHVFKEVPPDLAANEAAYADPTLPLHPDLMPALLAFIGHHP